MFDKNNLAGQKYVKLTVLEYAYSKKGKRYWRCQCDCGNVVCVQTAKLKSKNTKSCGCLKYETKSNFIHGKHNTRLYNIWQGMKQRCYNPNSIKYKNYGGRGIKVCEERKNDFMIFYNWAMTNGYDDFKTRKEQSLDRINNDGNYEPSNCRWVTHSKNCRNRNDNVYLTKNGISKTIAEWCEELNLDQRKVSARVKKYDNIDDILSQEDLTRKKHLSNTGEFGISKDKKNKFQLYINHKYVGQYKTLEEAIKKREEVLENVVR